MPQWMQNLGFTSTDAAFAGVIIVLIVLTAAGGDLGEIGWWGLIFLALIAIMAKWGGYLTPAQGYTKSAATSPSSTGFSLATGASPGVT